MADKTPDEIVEPVAPVVPEVAVEPVTEAAPVAADLVEVDLGEGVFHTNGKAQTGKVSVTADVAEDLNRRLTEYLKVERERFISRTITANSGTLDAAGK